MKERDELKELEDTCQEIELWLFGHKKEVDQKRLETYDLIKRVVEVREKQLEERRGAIGNKSDNRGRGRGIQK